MCQSNSFQVVNVRKFTPPQRKTLMHMYSNIFMLKPKELTLLVLPNLLSTPPRVLNSVSFHLSQVHLLIVCWTYVTPCFHRTLGLLAICEDSCTILYQQYQISVFFLFYFQFCNVAWLANVHNTKFYSNLALKNDMKGTEFKHPSMLLVTC
jgi:hypothetical protein